MKDITELVTMMARPGDRPAAAGKLASLFRGQGALVFVRDAELGLPLPALGFPQTLPDAKRWRVLVEEAFENGLARGNVWLPQSNSEVEVLVIANGAALAMWPADSIQNPDAIRSYLPLLACIYEPERERFVIEGQLSVANNTTREVNSLARQLDLARLEMEQRVHERTTELRASIKELEGFTYSVAHDLRAPLRAIYSTARILEEDFKDKFPAEAALLLQIQADRAVTLGKLIDDLLQLSRISRSEIQRSAVNVTVMAHQVLESIFASFPDCRCQFDFCIDADLLVHADARLLKLALQNLLENAVKFSPGGGRISVGQTEGVVFVRDEGVGFENKYSLKIFGPFERLVTADEFPGTGIGLANVQRIVDRHGGKVWAQSSPGKGTTVYFTLSPSKSLDDAYASRPGINSPIR
jgi:signal transduction histidine kinase